MIKYPVWFFDATGSILKKIKNQNKAFHYSLVFHDRDFKCILPAAEFITTNHTSASISQFLFLIKKIFQQISGKLDSSCLPKMIVTDHSWALINAVSEVFNYSSVSQYLDWCYSYIIEKNKHKKNRMPTILYICSTHFLKIIIQKVQKVNAPGHVKSFFKRVCGYLLNTTTIEDFDTCFQQIYIIFGSKFKNMTVIDSQLILRKAMGNQILSDTIKIDEEEDDLYEEALNLSAKEHCEWIQPDNVTKNSPFTEYFDKKIIEINQKLSSENVNEILENEYYNLELLKIICSKLYIMPMWSGIMIKELKEKYPHMTETTRCSNNMVESYFSYLKNSILNSEDSLMPSQLIGPLFQRIVSKYIKFYQLKSKPLVPVNVDTEKWKKKTKRPIKKGIYYENINFFDTEFIEMEKIQRINMGKDCIDTGKNENKRILESKIDL